MTDRDRIRSILAFALRHKVHYPSWRWPRDTEADTARAADAILKHFELSDVRLSMGAAPTPHSTPGQPGRA